MPRTTLLKPTHKAIQQYYQALQSYSAHHVTHEGALETAFQRLLANTARLHHWTLIPKQKLQVKGKNIYPDGTLRDLFTRRGFWEAKDTGDDLDAEISSTCLPPWRLAAAGAHFLLGCGGKGLVDSLKGSKKSTPSFRWVVCSGGCRSAERWGAQVAG